MSRDENIQWMKVQLFGTWARRYYALQFPAAVRVEVVSIVTSGTCLEGAVLYQIGLLFGELYEEATGRAFFSRVKVLRTDDGCSVSSCFVVVIVIVVVVIIRRRS